MNKILFIGIEEVRDLAQPQVALAEYFEKGYHKEYKSHSSGCIFKFADDNVVYIWGGGKSQISVRLIKH